MPTFAYKALTPQKQVVKGKIDDATKVGCIKKLKRNGLEPISLDLAPSLTKGKKEKKRKNAKINTQEKVQLGTARVMNSNKKTLLETLDAKTLEFTSEKITSRDIRIFTQNFYLLKKANFNNIHALKTVIETTENPKLKAVLEDILSGVEGGDYMYKTMEYYSNIFPYIYINMIKVGELSGSLEVSLQQAVKYLDDNDALTKKLKKILLPNILMFVGIFVMLIVGTIVGVPMLQGLFDSIGTEDELPAATLAFSRFLDAVGKVWYIPVGIIVAIVVGAISYISTPSGRYNFDYFKYKMPVFGKLIYLLDFSRLIRNMTLNLKNGMRIQDALEVSKNVLKNSVMLAMIETAINNIFIGKSWIEPFEEAGLGSRMTVEMLNIGMQTDLTEMMDKLLLYMDTDIDNTMEKIIKVLPEISYSIVGVVLVFFVVVILVPCIQIYMGGFLFSAYGF